MIRDYSEDIFDKNFFPIGRESENGEDKFGFGTIFKNKIRGCHWMLIRLKTKFALVSIYDGEVWNYPIKCKSIFCVEIEELNKYNNHPKRKEKYLFLEEFEEVKLVALPTKEIQFLNIDFK